MESAKNFEIGKTTEGFSGGGDWTWRLEAKWLVQDLVVFKCEVC